MDRVHLVYQAHNIIMFSGIWAKVTAALGIIVAVLAAALKFKSAENTKLKREIKVKDKKEEIRKDQVEARTEILEDEKRRIKDADTTGYTADDLNKL